ncbi:MAG: hypothetical protein HFH35_06030 [Eubacterium sp.]|nr:hypothetical protein [Eubacterium sp.]
MDLTSEQAYALDQEDGVTVEPNMTLNAAELTETTLLSLHLLFYNAI